MSMLMLEDAFGGTPHNAAVRIMPHRGRFPAIIAVFEQIVAA
jgi:mannose/fructose-specific phosphotransferase system component IIA